MRGRTQRPVVITDAERSQDDQLRTRQTRYILMMSVRVLALIVAAIVVTVQPPLLWLWLACCAVGMIITPWVAVVLANDRLPAKRRRFRRHLQKADNRSVPAAPPAATIELEPPASPAGDPATGQERR